MIIDKPLPGQLPELRQLWHQAFGDPEEFIQGFFRTGFSPERCRCVSVDSRLAAALYWFDCLWQGRKTAYIYAVATEKEFQGQGLCRALMEDTHSHLQRLGYAGTALVPVNEALFSLYEKLGYRAFCPVKRVTVETGPEPKPVRSVSADTYGVLRLQMMPENGIIQQGDTLSYLASYAEFYTGSDTLFCAVREGDILYLQEFLGDASCLPGILNSLGAEKGVVRLPGTDAPFAMYRSLTGDSSLPSYFGIPLD